MPKLKAEITTRTEVDLSTKLTKQLKVKLGELREKKAVSKAAGEAVEKTKTELEMLFAEADEYEALEEGVRVETPYGPVPMKIVKGQTAGRLDVKKLMKKFKLTTKDIESCKSAPKDKKPYLGVWLPDESDDEEGEDE
jgi:hypothetical protein